MNHLNDPLTNLNFASTFVDLDPEITIFHKETFKISDFQDNHVCGRERIDSEEFETSSNERSPIRRKKNLAFGLEDWDSQRHKNIKKNKGSQKSIPSFMSLEVN